MLTDELQDYVESIKDTADVEQLREAAEELTATANHKRYKCKNTTESVMRVLKDFFKEGVIAVQTSKVFDALMHLDRSKVRKAVRELIKEGEVYLPKEEFLQIVK